MNVLMRMAMRPVALAVVVVVLMAPTVRMLMVGIMFIMFVIVGMNVLMHVAVRPLAVAMVMNMLMAMNMGVGFLTGDRRLAASANRAH